MWFLKRLDLHSLYGDQETSLTLEVADPVIMNYTKLNFVNTVLSKRKLAKLVDAGLVEGWDDPRMPTVRGTLRTGMQIPALLSYISAQLLGKGSVHLEWSKLESYNVNVLNTNSRRLYGLGPNRIEIVLEGKDLPTQVMIPNHPSNSDLGTRVLQVTDRLYVDPSDFVDIPVMTRFTLAGIGNATLTTAYPGSVVLKYDKMDTDFKNSIKITWLPNDTACTEQIQVRKYGNLLKKENLEDTDDILDVFDVNSLITETWLIETGINEIRNGETIQIMRKGYFYLDNIPFRHLSTSSLTC